jgi:hypothetical protein
MELMHRSRRERLAGCRDAFRKGVARRWLPLSPALLLIALSVLPVGFASTPASAASVEGTPEAPLVLPGDPAAGAAGPVDQWIVAGKPGELARGVAAVHRAVPVEGPANTWLIESSLATAFAADLENHDLLLYAEPNLPVVDLSYPQDRLADLQWWLPMIVDTQKTSPPRVTPSSPKLALIERSADPLHPDLAEARLEDPAPIGPEADLHGTIVAAIAGSPAEGKGIRGVWPGMKMRLFQQGEDCASATGAVYRAARAGSPVINMSYGFPSDRCFMHYQATEFAVQRGALPIAAAGNTFIDEANIPMRPATDPHVVSVSAVDEKSVVAGFATRNRQVDLTAPGVGLTAPDIYLSEGLVVRDHAPANGTSFSTPMVSAAATWLRQARSDLSARQIARLLTNSANDLGAKGWDTDYGAGLLNINAALKAPAPPDDPREPNDDIGWINGSLLRNGGRPIVAPRLYRPGFETRELVRATLSARDDPIDTYRMRIGGENTVIFRVDQLAGDVAVQTFRLGTASVRNTARAFAASDRKAPLPEGIKIVNRSRKARDFYLAVKPGSRQAGDSARYRVTVQLRR